MTNLSTFDHLYHYIMASKFFAGGFSQPDCLSRLFQMRKYIMDKANCNELLRQFYPNEIIITKVAEDKHARILNGKFFSPFAARFPDLVPEPMATCRFQLVLPNRYQKFAEILQKNEFQLSNANEIPRPMCIQLAGTGDHYFWRRRILMAKPLAKNNGVGSILLENPYYGMRKPSYQRRSNLRNVTDLFIMGGCLILESLVLLDWCEKEGFGPLAMTGISMGGHMSSLAACNYEKPVALVPCLSWSTASCVFTQGVLSAAVAWKTLQNQYFSDEFRKRESLILSALNEKFRLSQEEMPAELELVPLVSKNDDPVKIAWLKWSLINSYFKSLQISSHKTNNPTSVAEKLKRDDTKQQVSRFLHKILDEFTHLGLFSKPVDPSLIIVVCAGRDAYIPRDKVADLSTIWPEAEFRLLEKYGHIGAFLFEQAAFRTAVVDALIKVTTKYALENRNSQRA
uniref:Protein ABHD18 n=1 Tax=Romanomermis culicivorax TaxID=13658 RepID=A0A915I051_ROMCU